MSTARSCRHGRGWTQGCRACREDAEADRARIADVRAATNCAQGLGHATDTGSPYCDACGWDVRVPIPHLG